MLLSKKDNKHLKISEINKPEGFFNQYLFVTDTGVDRFAFWKDKVGKRKTLHVGCTDSPIFDPKYNLHIFLGKQNPKNLDGCDIDVKGMEELKKYVKGRYFNNLDNVNQKYDLVIVPEVVEHIENVHSFLEQVFKVEAKEYVISVPSFSYYAQTKFEDGIFSEVIHPEHQAWYSPYTLLNICRKFISEKDGVELMFLADRNMVGISIIKNLFK